MTRPTISIGTQDFEKIRREKLFYIDKTEFIKEWWESQDDVTLITRPRRFGKTLNLSMLECFFSNQYEGRGDLFEGLSIWEGDYRRLQGSYPVIFLSFANIKGNTYEMTHESLLLLLTELYAQHRYLLDGEHLSETEKEYFRSVNARMTDATAVGSLNRLSAYLSRYYGKKVLIFLDEYDTPMQEAYVYGYWKELTEFIRSLFNATFKTNPNMERALMTGITKVGKESIFSDLNNPAVITTTTNRYAKSFGFTETEVFAVLDMYGMSDRKEAVKAWYDGFTFGSQRDVYNPWSIINFLREEKLKAYWANTSSNRLVSQLIRQGTVQLKMEMEALLGGNNLETEIDEEIVFDQLQKKKGAIWSLLLASGYLKVANYRFDENSGKFMYCLSLTNREVKLMFNNMISDWFSEDEIPYNDFLKALLQDDVEYMNEYMNEVALQMISSFDTGKKPSERANPERFYHGLVLGLVAELAGKYKVSSNRESGFGRYDVMLEPLKHQGNAYILEFKVRNPRKEKTLEDTVQNALTQIEEKKYDKELIARGIAKERIRHYGFAFEGNTVLIG